MSIPGNGAPGNVALPPAGFCAPASAVEISSIIPTTPAGRPRLRRRGGDPTLGIPVDARRELRIRELGVAHVQVDVRAVRASLEERAGGEYLVLRPPVLPHEPAQVAEALPAAER